MLANITGKLVLWYLVLSSLAGHAVLLTALLLAPDKVLYLKTRGSEILRSKLSFLDKPAMLARDFDINKVLPPYKARTTRNIPPNTILVNGRSFSSLQLAAHALVEGDEMIIGPGTYREAMVIKANNVSIEGDGEVVLDGIAANEKGAILVQGDWTHIRNIECRDIKVNDRNGACVRLEGKNLLLDHVYFHDSEEGLLAGRSNHGLITITNSRFENLGAGAGQAHGIYVGGDELVIDNSIFIRSKQQGMEIKSRTRRTHISRTIVASLDGRDSRLLDIPNGGELTIVDSVLAQGPMSVNRDVIGFGLEGITHTSNQIRMENNIIIMERPAGNNLIHQDANAPPAEIHNNIIVSDEAVSVGEGNTLFDSRQNAGIPGYPYLPGPQTSPDRP